MRQKIGLFVLFGLFLAPLRLPAQEQLLSLADSLIQTPQAEVAADLYRLVIQRFPDTYWAQRARIGLLRYALRGGARNQALQSLETLLNSSRLPELASLLAPLLMEDSSGPFLRYRLLLARRVPGLPQRPVLLEALAADEQYPELARTALRTLAADYDSLHAPSQIRLALQVANEHPALAGLLLRRYPGDSAALAGLAQLALQQADTLKALHWLRKPSSQHLRSLKARLYLALGDPEGTAQILADDPDTLPGIADLKALAWQAIGLQARLEDLLPYLQNRRVRARILLVTGHPRQALAVLDSPDTSGTDVLAGIPTALLPSPEALRLEALLQLHQAPEAAVFFLRHPTHRFQGYRLARMLDSLGFVSLALQVAQVAETLPSGPVFVPRDSLLVFRARHRLTPGLKDTLQMLNLQVPLLPLEGVRDSILLEMARGLPLLEGARQLLSEARDPWGVIRLLSGLKLNKAGYRLLAEAYITAYEYTGNEAYARQAEALLQGQKLEDLSLFVRLHRRYRPEALLQLDTLKVDRRWAPDLVAGLLAAHRPDLARQVAARSHLRDRALRFQLFLANHLLDSAYAVLDFHRPLEVVALAETLATQNAPDLAYDLLGRVDFRGFSICRHAAHLRISLAAQLGRWPEVVQQARQYLAEYPATDTLRLLLARGLLETGHPEAAYLRALPLQQPEAQRIQGLALLRAGYEDWALQYHEVVPELGFRHLLNQKDVLSLLPLPMPRDSALLHRYLVLLMTTGHEDFALRLADSAATLGILSPATARLAQVEALVQQGEILAAQRILKEIHQPDPRARAWYLLGVYWMRHQDFEKAKEAFFKVIQWGDPETRGRGAFKLATVLFQQRRYREALDYYQMATELLSHDPQTVAQAYHNMAICLKRLKDLEGARQAYRTLIQRFPDREEALDARISLALLDIDLNRPAEGYQTLAFVEGLMPQFAQEAEVQYWMGALARMQGQTGRALGHFARVYTFHGADPQWAPLARYEAALLLEQSGQASRARQLFQQLLQHLDPSNPLYNEVKKHLER